MKRKGGKKLKYLNTKDEVIFISTKMNCCPGIIMKYLTWEDEYFALKGIIENSCTENDEPVTVDVSEMNDFISEKSGLSLSICEKISDCETLFYLKIGLIEKDSFSIEEIESMEERLVA